MQVSTSVHFCRYVKITSSEYTRIFLLETTVLIFMQNTYQSKLVDMLLTSTPHGKGFGTTFITMALPNMKFNKLRTIYIYIGSDYLDATFIVLWTVLSLICFGLGFSFGVNSFMGEMVMYLYIIHFLKKHQRGESFIAVKSLWELLTSIIFLCVYIYI